MLTASRGIMYVSENIWSWKGQTSDKQNGQTDSKKYKFSRKP